MLEIVLEIGLEIEATDEPGKRTQRRSAAVNRV